MSDDKPPVFPSVGRGGRGAMLLAALAKNQRRPGQPGETEKTIPSTSGVTQGVTVSSMKPMMAIGRAALLSQFLKSSKSSASETASSATASTTTSTTSPVLPSFGRGAKLQQKISEQTIRSPMATESLPKSEATVHVPYDAMSKLTISKPEETPLITRRGKEGTRVDLTVNYIRLIKTGENNRNIHEYHVSFNPVIDNKAHRFRILRDFSNTIGTIRVFDGVKLFLPIKLAENLSLQTKRPDDSTVHVTFKFIGIANDASCMQLYNILFKKVMHHLNLARIGCNFYDSKASIHVPQYKLEVWPGYVTAVSEREDGVMLNCDASFRVLRKVTAYEVLYEASVKSKSNMKDVAFVDLVGAVVLTRYNNKTYRIDDIAWDQSPRSTFEDHSGNSISYIDYYRKAYDIEISDDSQPLLIHNPKKQDRRRVSNLLICLIPELCHMTGLTDEMRNDFKVMRDIAIHTRISPEQRMEALRKFRRNVMENAESCRVLAEWGLALDQKAADVSGRILPSERIYFKETQCDAGSNADWGHPCSDGKMISSVDLTNWIIICVKRNQQQVSDFQRRMLTIAKKLGWHVNQPRIHVLNSESTDAYLRAVRDLLTAETKMIVFVFPTSRDDRYSAVKKLCCVDMPVPTQVIIAKTISNPQKLGAVTQKIALQINCKLGGELWAVQIPIKNTMICGTDVYHDSAQKGKSVAAFVASMNKTCTRWFSKTHFQNPGEELITGLTACLVAAVRKYYEVNHCLPDKIILYRDGVGDGQLNHVSCIEIPQLIESLRCFSNQDYNPSLTVIITQKRISTRMFLKSGRHFENPPPGTILDEDVTRKNWYDFFLVSQHVRQGTVTPTHYIVIHDSSTLKPDHLQRLTYKLTHLYYNWPGTIRVPAPCQYAHKFAYLVGQNIHRDTAPDLSDRLFYL